MTINFILENAARELEADKKEFSYFPQQLPSAILKVQEPINEALKLAMSITYGQLKDQNLTMEDIKPELNECLFKTIGQAIRLLNSLNKEK